MLVSERDIQVKGEMPGESIDMSLDQNGLAHIMSVLTDLYSDKAGAAIREVITNALDSHIAADTQALVEVSTPNKLNPYFVVRDFGVGMSREDIINIVSKYGASTKRNSNKEAGMLGLGFKAPLTYTDQFTVIGIKDNIKTTVLVSRNAIGIGSMKILTETKSNESNGVTIKIPVNYGINDFIAKVVDFCTYVRSGLILDGQKPSRDWIFVSDNFALVEKDTYWNAVGQEDRIVMGGVSYPVKNTPLSQKYRIVYYAPMGSVDFTPSREHLEYTVKTNKTLSDMRDLYSDDLSKYVKHRFASCKTYHDAWIMARTLKNEYDTKISFTFEGKPVSSEGLRYKLVWWPEDLEDPDENVGSSQYANIYQTSDLTSGNYIVISNFDNLRFSRVQARKINKFIEEQKLDFTKDNNHAFLLKSDFDFDLIPEVKVYDWNVIKKTGVAKVKVRPKNKVCTWLGYRPNCSYEDRFEVDTKLDIYYEARSRFYDNNAIKEIREKKAQFVYVTDGQKQKFLEQFPKAKHISEWYEYKVAQYLASLTADMKDTFKYNYYCAALRYVKADDILDPELKKIAKNNADNPLESERNRHERYLPHCSSAFYTKNRDSFPKSGSEGANIVKKYPLLNYSNYYGSRYDKIEFGDHLLEYVNYVYKKQKGI